MKRLRSQSDCLRGREGTGAGDSTRRFRGLPNGFRDERGSVTAEFAVALPAMLLVLLLAIGAIALATQRLSLSSAAAQMARLEARGDAASAAAVLGGLSVRGGVAVQRFAQGPLHCVALSATPLGGALSAISVSGRGCAAVSEAGA